MVRLQPGVGVDFDVGVNVDLNDDDDTEEDVSDLYEPLDPLLGLRGDDGRDVGGRLVAGTHLDTQTVRKD